MLKASTRKTLRIAFIMLIAAAIQSGCFLPVPGFRDNNKKPPPDNPNPPHQQNNGGETNGSKKKRGVNHVVRRGETLHEISRMYGLRQDKIAKANNIKDPSKLKVGQVLFIPGAKKELHEPGSNNVVSNGNNGRSPPNTTPSQPSPKCPPGSIKFIWPAEGKLTSGFGMRNGRHHDGIDINNKIGSPIVAAADGVVIYEGRLGGYGIIVIIKHEGNFKTIYAHNRRNSVKKGDTVRQGQKVAELGASGNATGPHLHFEVRCGQEAVDPLLYLPKR